MSRVADIPWYMLSDIEEQEAALARDPGDPLGWVELGRLWMREGNFLRAEAAFTTAIGLHPDLVAAYRGRAEALRHIAPARSAEDFAHCRALGWQPEIDPAERIARAGVPPVEGTVYADLTDMMQYLAGNTVPSGIQRVVGNMLRQAVQGSVAEAGRIVPVLPDFERGELYATDMSLVLELIDAVEVRHGARAELDPLLEAIRASLVPVEPAAGDIFLVVGAFWIFPDYDLLKTLRDRGVAVTVFIHDIIPVSHAGYAEPAASEVFCRALVDMLEVASFVTTNSAFVAAEVRHVLREQMALDTPVVAVPLATELALAPPDPDQEAALRAGYPGGYVLCVCSIEGRKNHLYLARLWDALIRSGRTAVPTLVLVGKWDRKSEDFRDYLERTGHLGGKVRILSGISNAMLASLYHASRFTIFPSLIEGWGLPPGESLMLGKGCIASATSSIPEVGGDLIRYIDPLDVSTGLAQVTRLLDDPAELSAWEEDIRARFRPRSWQAFAADLLGVTRRLAAYTATRRPHAHARLAAGEMAVVGAEDLAAVAGAGRPLRTARMARAAGWHAPSADGVWSSAPQATLRFLAMDCRAGDRLRLIVELRRATGSASMWISLDAGMGETTPVELDERLQRFECDALVGENAVVELRLRTEGDPAHQNGQTVHALLSRIGFHGPDGRGRLALAEEVLIPA
ncbi:glycosyltransferase family 4 protein [Sphingomonas sp. PR090111-T3T-6A]|uniref:glycosyltransferase family 4 protein n=1 Tax=Sphingomonas sp. PR090111-T3T-6A TaxID=685778 RepID=UPI00037DD0A8|nr:glycosyltransferase family 1 protein [Sphingomonas sp. PR090111-T3T-6A]